MQIIKLSFLENHKNEICHQPFPVNQFTASYYLTSYSLWLKLHIQSVSKFPEVTETLSCYLSMTLGNNNFFIEKRSKTLISI